MKSVATHCKIFFILSYIFSFTVKPNVPIFQKIVIPSFQTNDKILSSKINSCGIQLEKKVLWYLKGTRGQFNCLKDLMKEDEKSFPSESNWISRDPIIGFRTLKQPGGEKSNHLKNEILYLAKNEFDLPQFLEKYPNFDGRDVIVGLIDDGISPHQEGFQKTTTGKRKYIAHFSSSSLWKFKFNELLKEEWSNEPLLSSYRESYSKVWKGGIDEGRSFIGKRKIDLNANDKKEVIPFLILKKEEADQHPKICIDTNVNQKLEKEECIQSFNETGSYGYWDEKKNLPLMANLNLSELSLKVFPGEGKGDSHGEGVASVMAGHKIGGRFDGIAPGSQIIDYGLSQYSNKAEEEFYTLSTFLKALEILGGKGAQIINMSYSFYFLSPQTQMFMKEALDLLIKKYNFVLAFSGGNWGPGLGSLNRRQIYPGGTLVSGAYGSQELYERVHGVPGLPAEGRVVYYSSIGPGPSNGEGPLIISPLASLVHADPQSGFRAFSGTSSSSPAAAGLAAILLSSLKQLGLPFNAKTLVHAIKLSGKALPQIPYLIQGHGVPKVERALNIYKRLLKGELTQDVGVEVLGMTSTDQVKKKGFLIFLPHSNIERGSKEFRVKLTAELSPLVSPEDRVNSLLLTSLDYSHSFLKGPKNHFLGGPSYLSLTLDYSEINWKKFPRGEIFSEIKILNQETGELLKVIPITLIQSPPLTQVVSTTRTLGAEEGQRIHFHATRKGQILKVTTKFLEGPKDYIYFRSYNPSGVKGKTYKVKEGTPVFLQFNQLGHHQLGIFKYRGGERKTKIQFTLAPVNITLLNRGLDSNEPNLTIESDLNSSVFQLNLEPKGKIVEKKIISFSKDEVFTLEVPLKKEDLKKKFEAIATPLVTQKRQNLRVNYIYELYNSNGELIHSGWGPNFLFVKHEDAVILKFKARIFDTHSKNEKKIPFTFSLRKKENTSLQKLIPLEKGTQSIALKKEEALSLFKDSNDPDRTLQVSLVPVFKNGDTLSMGTLEIY